MLDDGKARDFFVEAFIRSYDKPPEEITLDVDATDDPLHGKQEGRFFHGYYMHYCYLPLYIFCGDHLLAAKLRPSDIHPATLAEKAGALQADEVVPFPRWRVCEVDARQ